MPQILIPKVINRVWLGPDPVPAVFERYAETWRRHHPDWEVKLWRDDDLPPLSCQEEFERVESFKVKYDIVRLELLRQKGGVVMDLDVEALRPIDPLLDGVEACVTAMGEEGRAQRRRDRAEARFRGLLAERLLQAALARALPGDELATAVAAIAERRTDPYTAVDAVLARALAQAGREVP